MRILALAANCIFNAETLLGPYGTRENLTVEWTKYSGTGNTYSRVFHTYYDATYKADW